MPAQEFDQICSLGDFAYLYGIERFGQQPVEGFTQHSLECDLPDRLAFDGVIAARGFGSLVGLADHQAQQTWIGVDLGLCQSDARPVDAALGMLLDIAPGVVFYLIGGAADLMIADV